MKREINNISGLMVNHLLKNNIHRSSILYQTLMPNDPAIVKRLKRWASEYPDQRVRKEIKKYIYE